MVGEAVSTMAKRKRWDLEYRHTLDDRLIPINITSPVYSKRTKEHVKQMLKEEKEYIKKNTGEVRTYHISDLD
jgi:hypothetical protein